MQGPNWGIKVLNCSEPAPVIQFTITCPCCKYMINCISVAGTAMVFRLVLNFAHPAENGITYLNKS